jgi:histidinol-phosphate phosphatase family protein
MIDIGGRPFLEYLVELLKEQGFTRLLLLLGYRADVIEEHFEDGARFGLRIDYSITPPEFLTVRRMRAAQAQLDETFLLMYCDNYWPMVFERLWNDYLDAGTAAALTVYTNLDHYSRNTVRVGADRLVNVYDGTRQSADLNGVEIGYALLQRRLLRLMPEEDMPVEHALYPLLSSRRELLAHLTDHRYYSIGSMDRLPLTEAFLARRSAVILDRDGVLNQRAAPGEYVRNTDGFRWLPGALEALRALAHAGYLVIVASNQAGVSRGMLSAEALDAIDEKMRGDVRVAGGFIDAIYYCPHDWDAGCACRKPKPGLLFQAQRDFSLDLTRTYVLGDDPRDLEAAAAAGAPSRLVTPEEPLLVHVRRLLAERFSQKDFDETESRDQTHSRYRA